MRALELYAGIGGFAAALGHRVHGHEVTCAIEQSELALGVYRANFRHPTLARNLLGLGAADLARYEADLWWMSPPCQSFTLRGRRRDVDDPRAQSFLHVLELLASVRPTYVALENVPGFQGSRAHGELREVLARAGYDVRERLLCPTELGVPNRRRRFYLVASTVRLGEWRPSPTPSRRSLVSYLEGGDERFVDEAVVRDYGWAMQILDPADPEIEATCFTSAYGRSWVRSGAYLYTERGVRLFSPSEIARLLGFPPAFQLPGVTREKAYHLLGNSLSVDAVREVLALVR